MSGLTTVVRKEVTENIRDRRAIFNSLLLGPIATFLIVVLDRVEPPPPKHLEL